MYFHSLLSILIQIDMTFLRTLFCLLILFINFFQPSILHGQESFKKEQLRYSRVRTAYAEKESLFNEILEDHQLSKNGLRVYLRTS